VSPIQQSEDLHCRVRAFARASLTGAPCPESFEELALAIARHQASANRSRASRSGLGLFEELRPLPVDAFRVADVFAFAAADAAVCFRTSGTTSNATGRHLLRTTQTYEELSVLSGRRALIDPSKRQPWVVALMPRLGPTPTSSLGFMAQRFMVEFGGHAVDRSSDGEPEPWLLTAHGVDVAGLEANVRRASTLGRPVLLLATSFALVMLLDELRGRAVHLPPGSVVMQTGGFKGRTRNVAADELDERLVAALGEHPIVAEYGMTELCSQLYDGALGCELKGPRDVFLPPPWLRAVVLDPRTLTPLPRGEVGLAGFIDLANVDSAVYVVTQDLVQASGDGIRLIGRRPRAPLRGCSLAAEALWEGTGASSVVVPGSHVASGISAASSDVRGVAETASPIERVRRLVAAARRIADPQDDLGRRARSRIARASGLSAAAVELGLTLSLEAAPSEDELDELCSSMPTAPRVWVLLSANVFVSAHRAIACALAASDDVVVRPSRRDSVLAELLHEATGDLFRLTNVLAPEPADHVHAYGSDETLADLRSVLPSGVHLLAHGSGIGAGLLLTPGHEELAAVGFALDVVLFEQRGCLSPRVIGVDPRCDVDAFRFALSRELTAWARRCPPPAKSDEERADDAWYRSAAEGVGEGTRIETENGAPAGSVVWMKQPVNLLVPPPGRNLLLFIQDQPWVPLVELGELLTCVGVAAGQTEWPAVRHHLPNVRLTEPGCMQRPRFDGPVDVRGRHQD